MSELFDLKPDTEMHRKILNRVNERYKVADRARASERPRWNKAEDEFIAYIPKSDEEKLKEKNFHDHGEPDYYTLLIPYNYAIVMTAHTYWTTVFLSREPIFQFTARHGEGKNKTQAVESLMDYQMNVGENIVPLYLWILDMAKYGEGIVGCYWQDEYRYMSEIVEEPVTVNGVEVEGKTKKVRKTKRVKSYQGNRLYNVKPHDWLPDPRVPVNKFQEGEFCGRQTEVGWNTILRGKANGTYHAKAVEKLRKVRKSQAKHNDRDRGSSQIDRPESGDYRIQDDTDDIGFVSLVEMYVELVPKEWGMGESEHPEKWMFTMAEEAVIIGARPLTYHHDRFPFAIQEYEMDAYSTSKRGMFDLTRSLNDAMTWLFNTHFHNVRQTLNNQFVVDPSKIVMKDLQSRKPGWMARMKPAAYGTDVRTAVQQFPVSDVTSRHLEQAEVLGSMMQRMSGVTDNIMGVVNPGGRKSATEIRTSSSASTNRMKTQAEYNSAQGWGPLAQMMLQNTQQFFDEGNVFKITGDLSQDQSPEMDIGPDEIQGFFDFVPVDGTLPIDRLAQASMWRELYETIIASEGLAQEFDLMAIFSYIARLSGAKNIDQFKNTSVQTGDPEELRQRAEAGELSPIQTNGGSNSDSGESGSRPTSRSRSRGDAGSEGRVEGAPEISGVGPVG